MGNNKLGVASALWVWALRRDLATGVVTKIPDTDKTRLTLL